MKIVYLGSEVPSNRKLLLDMGTAAFGFSYARAAKRGFPKTKSFSFRDYYPEDSLIVVHPGLTEITDDLDRWAADYQDFVVTHLDDIAGFVEFNHPAAPPQWVEDQRGFWEQAGEKFWPLWDGASIPQLHALADRFPEVGITGSAVESSTSLAGQAQSLSRSKGTVWHGLAVASPDNLRQVPFTTVATTAWTSPMRRGETIVWDGASIKRYPAKMKDQARRRYKHIVERAGLDYAAILADDAKEITRLAIWSYQQLENRMNNRKPPTNPFRVIQGGGQSDDDDDSELLTGLGDMLAIGGLGESGVGNSVDTARKPQSRVPAPREALERRFLPSMGVDTTTVVDGPPGSETIREVPVLTSTGSSVRQCNTCFVAANCPAFTEDTECAFHLPVQVKTREQMRALLEAMIEIQASRVAFAKFSEDLNGGYPDPNTSQEMDRLFKLVGNLKELDSTKQKVSITMEGSGQGGVLSRLFGERAIPEFPTVPENETTQIIQQSLEGRP